MILLSMQKDCYSISNNLTLSLLMHFIVNLAYPKERKMLVLIVLSFISCLLGDRKEPWGLVVCADWREGGLGPLLLHRQT